MIRFLRLQWALLLPWLESAETRFKSAQEKGRRLDIAPSYKLASGGFNAGGMGISKIYENDIWSGDLNTMVALCGWNSPSHTMFTGSPCQTYMVTEWRVNGSQYISAISMYHVVFAIWPWRLNIGEVLSMHKWKTDICHVAISRFPLGHDTGIIGAYQVTCTSIPPTIIGA